MKRRIMTVVVAACLLGPGISGTVAGTSLGPTSAQAKSCSRSFVHAVIGGQEKCLRRGEFCARARDREYRRYGFRCHKQDARGNYHLT
jgi:hypothetical protein